MADARTDGAHPQAATRAAGAALITRRRLREGILKKNGHGGGRGARRASTPCPLRCRRHTRSACSPTTQNPQTLRRLRRKDAQVQVRRSAAKSKEGEKKERRAEMWLQRTSRSQNVRHCARSIATHSRSSRAASCVVTTQIHDTLVSPARATPRMPRMQTCDCGKRFPSDLLIVRASPGGGWRGAAAAAAADASPSAHHLQGLSPPARDWPALVSASLVQDPDWGHTHWGGGGCQINHKSSNKWTKKEKAGVL